LMAGAVVARGEDEPRLWRAEVKVEVAEDE
jgi:hypothetical protein